jgi:hypothetical protein
MIYLAGFVFAGFAMTIIVLKAKCDEQRYAKVARSSSYEHEEGLDSFRVYMLRWNYIASNMFATVFSWCTMFGTKWWLHSTMMSLDAHYDLLLPVDPNSTLQRIILALVTTFGSFVLVFVLDKLSDMDCTGAVADLCCDCMISAISILVGFAWEQAFDAGVEVVAALTAEESPWYPAFTKLGLALVVAIIMIPAWRRHLLKKTLEAETRMDCTNCEATYTPDALYCHKCGERKADEAEEEEDG